MKFQSTKPLNIHCYLYFQWYHGFQSKLEIITEIITITKIASFLHLDFYVVIEMVCSPHFDVDFHDITCGTHVSTAL